MAFIFEHLFCTSNKPIIFMNYLFCPHNLSRCIIVIIIPNLQMTKLELMKLKVFTELV